ncbi:leucine-rich repeats and immunoglobulin-like domains protein 3 [Photinus pyralis]|nr:leucine-rich repeats and immunoglobulin-like domains protein 3 [Photinus pyralis]
MVHILRNIMCVLPMRWYFYIGAAVFCIFINETNASCRFTSTTTETAETDDDDEEYDQYNLNVVSHRPDDTAECLYISLQVGQHLQDQFTNLHFLTVNPTITHFIFEHSRIPTLFVSFFNNFPLVTSVKMSSTDIEQILPGAFNGLSTLQVLQLDSNRLTQITKGTLNHLSSLVILDMSNNHIDFIENDAFLGLEHLERLNLSHNALTSFSLEPFWYSKFIRSVDVSHNLVVRTHSRKTSVRDLHPISTFPVWSFFDRNSSEINNQFELNLSYNNISFVNSSHIPPTVSIINLDNNKVCKLTELRSLTVLRLSLHHNNVSNITVSPLLEYLDLSWNVFSKFQRNQFHDSKNLLTLHLGNNLIGTLDDTIFANTVKMRILSLDNNKLNHIPLGCFSSLSKLVSLNISGNQITSFEYGTFSGLQNLEVLDISANNLSYLYESTLHPLASLKNLYMEHNFVSSFDPYDLVYHIPSLKIVALNHNRWNCKSLLNIFSYLKSRGVAIAQGTRNTAANIHGIACETNSRPLITDPSGNNDTLHSANVSIVRFFNDEFLNSSFYRFFNNYSNTHFNEKDLEKVLHAHQNEISSSSFINQLNTTISKLIMKFKLIPDMVTNSGDQLIEQISKYFNNEFKETSFYKYFNQNWKGTNPYTSKENLLKEFLNVEFKNSSFYKFFNHDRGNPAKFEKIVDNNDLSTSIANLQKNLNTLLIVIVLLLCCLLVLIVIISWKNSFDKLITKKVVNGGNSQANIELL